MNLNSDAFLAHKDLRLVVLSYLSGSDLYHKIALLNKLTRVSLVQSKLLDQQKTLTMKTFTGFALDLIYAFELVDTIEIVVKCFNTKIDANKMASLICFRNSTSTK